MFVNRLTVNDIFANQVDVPLQIGVRTFEDDHNSMVVNDISNNTSEHIDNEIKKILQVCC